MITLYTILGLAPGASREELHDAFRDLALLHHPDRDGGDHDIYCRITEAWSVLGDVSRRAAYDAGLRLTCNPCPTCNGSGRVYKTIKFTQKAASACPYCCGSGWLERPRIRR